MTVIILSAPAPAPSSSLPVIVVQHTAEPLAVLHRSTIISAGFIRDDQPVAETLVVSLAMIMRYKFLDPLAQGAFSE